MTGKNHLARINTLSPLAWRQVSRSRVSLEGARKREPPALSAPARGPMCYYPETQISETSTPPIPDGGAAASPGPIPTNA